MGTVEVEGWRQEARPETEEPRMTFDEISMEKSKSFVNALQELRNLKPQLYSAADYCEKSYLHNEQKQMVLDNLKGYTVRALVNAVDHLGTVAYKLTDLFQHQSTDISNIGLKISCLDQQMLAFQHYMDKEGIGQKQLLDANQKHHHKHYILPKSAVHSVGFDKTRFIQNNARTLSWHISSESGSTAHSYSEGSNESSYKKVMPGDFHRLDAVETCTTPLSLSAHLQLKDETHRSPIAPHQDFRDAPKSVPNYAFKSSPSIGREIIRRNTNTNISSSGKSMFSVLFAKTKLSKQKKRRVYV
ncbi:Protein ABIL1 [Zostera marina]|uniref:Protein ABIL1 n=1 Tax=Zostera marina TaxID=29655 RepID=A0A0K9PKJ8_ZOSMR|nr:Protein ABIL1 [Zostera marina]